MSLFQSTWDAQDVDSSSMLKPRPVRIRLQDGRTLEGRMHVPDGQSVVRFLGLRRAFLNLTEVRWLDAGQGRGTLPHMGLRLAHMVWVIPLDAALPLQSALRPPDASRPVELTLHGGLILQVRINIADEQRMSDYFDSNPDFIPLRSVRVGSSADVVDRMAVHRDAILTIRET